MKLQKLTKQKIKEIEDDYLVFETEKEDVKVKRDDIKTIKIEIVF